jgi:hypothetical protein
MANGGVGRRAAVAGDQGGAVSRCHLGADDDPRDESADQCVKSAPALAAISEIVVIGG